MVLLNQGIGTSAPKKGRERGTNDVSYQGEILK